MNHVVDFGKDFTCIKDRCPFTCCKGWGILIDDAAYMRQKNERGLLGARLRLFSHQNKAAEREVRFLADGRCPFFTGDRLCELTCKNREELMPKICRVFPRRCIAYGDYRESSLELACYEAARLFVGRAARTDTLGAIGFEQTDTETETYFEVPHVDTDLFAFFLRDRKRVLTYWNAHPSCWGYCLLAIYEHTYVKQYVLGSEGITAAESLSLPLTEEQRKLIRVPDIAKTKTAYGFFSIRFLNTFIYGRLSVSCTKARNPYMYRLIRCYKKRFGGLYEAEADVFFEEHFAQMLAREPKLVRLFHTYFFYILMQSYLEAQADCYLLGPVIKSLFHFECMMLFVLVAYEEGTRLCEEKLARIICSVEKAVRHSISFGDAIMDEVRKLFRDNM